MPISLLNWEIYLPDRLEVRQFGGNSLAEVMVPPRARDLIASDDEEYNERTVDAWTTTGVDIGRLAAGQIGGIVVDARGAVIAGATVTVANKATGLTQTAKTDSEGHWVLSGMQSGPVRVTIASGGFKALQQELDFNPSQPARLGSTLEVGTTNEEVTITASSVSNLEVQSRRLEDLSRKTQQAQLNAPSQNVANLQKRVSGILPVRVDVPKDGKSYRFVRPLVMGEETKVTFQYKSR